MIIGYIGGGKMGTAQIARLLEKGYRVVAYNRTTAKLAGVRRLGAAVVPSISSLISATPRPHLVWLMVSHKAVDGMLAELVPHLAKGDTVIDGGNSFYEDSARRARALARRGIHLLDVGVSGGPHGARHGACLMVGGEKKIYKKCEKIFKDLAASKAYAHLGPSGAGHFTKMVHNGIEYGMMQAIAEGCSILKRSQFKLNLRRVAGLYNNRSVIESRLTGWLVDAYKKFGEDLGTVSGSVSHTGEGEWTVKTAKKFRVPARVIEEALDFRVASARKPSYTGKILSALRNQFGGHDVKGST